MRSTLGQRLRMNMTNFEAQPLRHNLEKPSAELVASLNDL